VPADVELTGPMVARLWVELDGIDDASLFVGVERWRDGKFVEFEGSYGYGRNRVATGWQRVALRALDPELSQPWEPVPTCAELHPVSAGEVVAVDVAPGAPANSCGWWLPGAGCPRVTRWPVSSPRPIPSRSAVASPCTGARITTRTC
jgi:predicted acyl esterase